MKKCMAVLIFWICLLTGGLFPKAAETIDELQNLYARSAILTDGSSGRVLFEKSGEKRMPMASTTKIMTCILVLENGCPDDITEVSEYAASQPKVHLGAVAGTKFCVKDLLYSMMLESHNDSAVILAEYVDGTVERFVKRMNQKAMELGCKNTHFVTPNGLDASDEGGEHGTTAYELAKIMEYCVWESPEKEVFRQIAVTRSYEFMDAEKRQTYYCSNHNSFLDMMEGIVAGKTGFTSAAGYCYVCAAEIGGRKLVGVVLACGWPYNRSYKWQDMKKLISYGESKYKLKKIPLPEINSWVSVKEGIADSGNLCETAYTDLYIDTSKLKQTEILISDQENIRFLVSKKNWIDAPVRRGEKVGEVRIMINHKLIQSLDICIGTSVREKRWEDWLIWMIQKYRI